MYITTKFDPVELVSQARFDSLATEWKLETAFMSSVSDMSMHWAYQQIIGMGLPAVPLMLRELETKPEHWFWALHAITGHNCHVVWKGNLDSMAAAWLKWGRENGFLEEKANEQQSTEGGS